MCLALTDRDRDINSIKKAISTTDVAFFAYADSITEIAPSKYWVLSYKLCSKTPT